jgi:hypothetical protein
MCLEVHYTEGTKAMGEGVYFCQHNVSDEAYYNKKLKEIYTKDYYTKDSCLESLKRDNMGMFRDPDSTKSYKLTTIKKVINNLQTKQEENKTLVDFQESFTLMKDSNGDYDWNWV